jgi:hypothetical protein
MKVMSQFKPVPFTDFLMWVDKKPFNNPAASTRKNSAHFLNKAKVY